MANLSKLLIIFRKLDIDFPDKRGRIQKCGKILQSRNDCAEEW